MPHAHPLDALDSLILHARTRRANLPRFCESYWQADDELAWLRMVRDELARTGDVRPAVAALLGAAAVPVQIERGREPIAFPVEPLAAEITPPEDMRVGNEVVVGAA